MGFIDNIRRSDNATKLRYVILFTGISSLFVVGIWAIALRGIVEAANTPKEIKKTDDISFIGRFTSAWDGIVDRTKKTAEFFKEKAGKTNEIIIEKP